jgi:hypothetical protein
MPAADKKMEKKAPAKKGSMKKQKSTMQKAQ